MNSTRYVLTIYSKPFVDVVVVTCCYVNDGGSMRVAWLIVLDIALKRFSFVKFRPPFTSPVTRKPRKSK